MHLKRANEDLWKMAWHLSITTNRIREVMICPLEVLIPLNKEGNLQAVLAAQPLLFTVQHCLDGSAVSFSPLLTSTTIFTDWSAQVSHPFCIQQLLCSMSEAAGDRESGSMSAFHRKEKKESKKERCHRFRSLEIAQLLSWSSYNVVSQPLTLVQVLPFKLRNM